jgi:RimJ/RimL family protein N-acetyltransferase
MIQLKFRKALESDLDLYFKWANDPLVRVQSYNSDIVSFENHVQWFTKNFKNPDFYFYLFQNDQDANVGQVRIQKNGANDAIIGLSIDASFRGLGLGSELLIMATNDFLSSNPQFVIHAYIKQHNISSKTIFEKSGFQLDGTIDYNHHLSYHYIKYANR